MIMTATSPILAVALALLVTACGDDAGSDADSAVAETLKDMGVQKAAPKLLAAA